MPLKRGLIRAALLVAAVTASCGLLPPPARPTAPRAKIAPAVVVAGAAAASMAVMVAPPHPHWPAWFTDVGGATPGPHPTLEVTGQPGPGAPLWVAAWDIPLGKASYLIIGSPAEYTPLHGGYCVPHPSTVLQLKPTQYGTVGLALPIEVPISSGLVYLQLWYKGSAGKVGSNAVALDLSKAH